jgi:superfamily I DNA/RNA helicase/mRNA-degrading endonuclease RelE of RelBE toxin-antitoxin system
MAEDPTSTSPRIVGCRFSPVHPLPIFSCRSTVGKVSVPDVEGRHTLSNEWLSTSKPSFLTELLALPPKETHQVLEKVALLLQDPTPDAKTKKLLKHIGEHQVCRLRSGNYRIFYTYKSPHVSLLRLRRRDDSTYDKDLEPEFLGGPDLDLDDDFDDEVDTGHTAYADEVTTTKPEVVQAPPEDRAIPVPIVATLLRALRIPSTFHRQLIAVATESALLGCAGVPDEHLLRLHEYLFERPIEDVLAQPDYLTSVEDLQRYKDGDLLGFLLVLSPEQQRYVIWALNAAGPTLVKGGPGTGKSIVALYRLRAMLEALRKTGIGAPRLLFTTYTKTLVAYSEQLLGTLLGDDAGCVTVCNVDKLVMEIAGPTIRGWNVVTTPVARSLLATARAESTFAGSAQEQATQRETVARLSDEYLLEEFDSVIEAHRLANCDEYLQVARPGRTVPLNATQRRGVWQVYTAFSELLRQRKLLTWGGLHKRAAEVVRSIPSQRQYDAVVIDEAQDLDPNSIRLLVGLCRTPNRLFLTADANQSIYGSQFRWRDVHESLRFQGRTGSLKTNYRTTRQIGTAVHAYLSDGAIDDEPAEQDYRNDGARPSFHPVATVDEETEALVGFLRKAQITVRLGLGACAVLVPSANAAQAVTGRLQAAGLQALAMPGDQLDLKKQCVKVIVLKSAKGLEFPIVALAGFLDGPYPFLPSGASPEELAELYGRERRTMFVGMSRAMRALLVTIPAESESPLMRPFDPQLWDIG